MLGYKGEGRGYYEPREGVREAHVSLLGLLWAYRAVGVSGSEVHLLMLTAACLGRRPVRGRDALVYLSAVCVAHRMCLGCSRDEAIACAARKYGPLQ